MIELLLGLTVLPVILPAFSLLVLTVAALGAGYPQARIPARAPAAGVERPRVAVLVPAHDESVHVLPTIACLQAQLGPRDRLVVIADNCSDDTAARARAVGADAIERCDPQRRGKGYALAFGVDRLRLDPPEVVLVVDADCILSADAVTVIARECLRSARPVQMLDLMSAGAGAGLKLRVLEFAMLMKNLVRPLGSFRLGQACHLMGTGMAFPWPLIAGAELATGHVAEDMKLGVELTKAGHAPRFLVDAQVSSAFVRDTGVAKVQKSRWEHGHLATLAEELPGLLRAALLARDPALMVLAMDLMIPPVAFYFLLLGALLAATVLAAWIWPVFGAMAVLMALGTACFALGIGLAWFFFGRHLLSARELLSTPLYALWKLPVYVAFFLKKRSSWVRTRRD
ncbi:MAG: glycosyltransferase family 2 protein [Candidatus Competibacter sp.]|nr:glycosyltransferase family 2 protein [Candidatus Competibacter sp.]